ncbi:TetR-like C-terminal domain-containing protein [Spelaeicoccus albus]|uniref:AcrR family transcriptional regulator n=1 Tax=Spelaeicoccus albus TaxID=1280376 RepID=A0A7Z0D1D5_9MICO|nr:TetR-like C-terminal domain-containing protein [Spelaeicoccus albus]NYI66818.1 AcrR family transcriptional regulator [Spelaeicoccus albus]
MSPRTGTRPGGRSARIQRAVHQATQDLLDEIPRANLTVPLIAERAEVDATTVYRRWGTLAQLLSDVAANRIRETPLPEATGSLRGDLTAWSQQFAEEISSGPGRGYVADVLAGDATGDNAKQCADYAAESIEQILDRFDGQPLPSVDDILEHVIAPLIYRILFAANRPLTGYAEKLVTEFLDGDHTAVA